MININELVGIIEGINFNVNLSDKELSIIKSWIEENKNLTKDNSQYEIISILNNICDDYSIENDSKIILFEHLEKLLFEVENKLLNISDFKSIIEGINCDENINEHDINILKEIISKNKFIETDNLTKEFCETILYVTEKRILTNKEQQHLLKLIRIKNTNFETKLDNLCKKVKERSNIGNDLICIMYDKYAIAKIHSMAEKQLIEAISSYNNFHVNKEIVFISLVLIGMLEYNGNYYDNVSTVYKNLYSRYKEQKIEGTIRELLSKYKKKENFEGRIINVALENAIVPQKYLSDFFEFIFDIYERNFEYDLSDDLYDDFLFVFEGLRSNMLSEGDDIRLDVTQKTYKLIVSTKRLILTENGLDAIINLCILIVELIDKRFWDKEVKLFNPYLKFGYDNWGKQFKENSQIKNIRKNKEADFISRWEPKFYIENDTVYLNPPIHRIKSKYDYRDIEIVILNDNKEIYRNNSCDIRHIIGGYQVNLDKINIDMPLGKLTYKLIAKDEVIYDSKDKLYRNYIVFNENGQEISNNKDYEGTAVICYRKGESEFNNSIVKEHYCIGYMNVKIGDAICIGDYAFNFSKLVDPSILGRLYNNCFVCETGTENYIPVYEEVNAVVFDANNSSDKFEIIINGISHKLNDFRYETTAKSEITKYVINLELTKSRIYMIEVNQLDSGKKNRILTKQFAYDNYLEFRTEILSENTYIFKIVSELLSEDFYKEITIDDFDIDFVKFTDSDKEYSYMLPFDTGFYKIDN